MVGILEGLSKNHMTTESTLSTLSDIHISQRTYHNLLVIMLPWRSENHILVGCCNFYLCVVDLFYLTKSLGLFAMSQIISILKTILYYLYVYIYIILLIHSKWELSQITYLCCYA